MALLFVDLLGTKSQWAAGGSEAALARFAAFEQLIAGVIGRSGVTPPRLGSVESDAAAFDFSDANDALRFGAFLYQDAFLRPRRPADARLWLRGALVEAPDGSSLRTTAALNSTIGYVQRTTYSAPLLQAIAIEKCGFKGMRLVVEETLLTTATRNAFAQKLKRGPLKPFRRLNHSPYPNQISKGFSDLLWMLIDDGAGWEQSARQMNRMLRWASGDVEEFQQAAATQLLFNESAAIVGSLT